MQVTCADAWTGNAVRSLKEVIQPHLPIRLPCYDFTPVMNHTVVTVLPKVRLATSGATHSHGVTGGVYKARERIHRSNADLRLLAIPTSWSRVADSNPDWEKVSGIGLPSRVRSPLSFPLSYVCSPGRKGHDDLTSSPPSSGLSPAVSLEFPPLRAGNKGQGLRSLRDLTQHLTTRADDSHAPPGL